MSGSRERVLNRLRERCARDDESPEDRLARRPRGPLPALAGRLEERFVRGLEAAGATWTRVESLREIPAAAEHYLERQGLAPALALAPHPLLEQAPWPDGLSLRRGPADAGDRAGLGIAWCALGETGSLVMASGAGAPLSLALLPEHFLCVIETGRIVRHMEDVWDLLRAEPAGLPRALTLVTGPSRTADVEQTLQIGAQGPRRVHALLLGKSSAP